jgi:imidazolonepropionase-like amidohydrolase
MLLVASPLLPAVAAVSLGLALVQEPKSTPAQPTPTAAKALLLRGATLHTQRLGEEPRIEDLLVVDGRIRTLGPEATSWSDREVLELAGKHVLPGLLDAHVNFDPAHDPLYLAAGVTWVRDLGGDHFALTRERLPARRDLGPGPALATAGAVLDGDPPASARAVVLRNADAAESYLPILFQEQVDFLSLLPGLPDDAWRRTLALAKEQSLAAYGPRPAQRSLAEAIAAGQSGFHSLDALLPPGETWNTVSEEALSASIAALAAAKVPIVPLFFASRSRLEDQSGPEWRALLGLLAPSYEAWWRAELAGRAELLRPENRAALKGLVAKQARALLALHAAGARLVPGSGAPQPWLVPGTALHQELAQWVAAGLSTDEVLALATREAAAALGLAGQRGTLEPGAWADLVVLDADPRGDLARLLDPAFVVVRGRVLTRAELAAGLTALDERQSALRAELARPLEVAPPPQAEEGVPILEGTIESTAFGERVASERYRVVRIDPKTLLFTTRVLYPPAAGGLARELTLEQFVHEGRLQQVHASLREGESLLEHDGLWTANTWRMQTRLDGHVVNTPAPLREQPACVDAGTLTTLLVLAQQREERVPLVQLHPGLDGEAVAWKFELGADGNFRVRTHLGYKAFELDATGALVWALSKVGNGVVESRALSATAFGGAGLLPVATPKPESADASTPPKPGG